MGKKITIIGSGFSSLSAACYLAKAGHEVDVYEKNETIGGRARQFKKDGFTFDMGPSWYWMPDVFDRFFADFGKKTSDYYDLIKLSPAYRVYYGINDFVTIADNLPEIVRTFETIEKGSGQVLEAFIADAKKNYDIAILDLVYRPGVSPLELITIETAMKVGQFFSNISKDVRKKFTNQRLIQILEFPVLFLGAKPSDTPSFYSFMNYADFGLGTWHPKTGMFDVVRAMESLAKELGVKFHTNCAIERINVDNKTAKSVVINGNEILSDAVLSGADYAHTETLLPDNYKQYSDKYWESRVFAPSSLLFYVGFDRKLDDVSHHALFFDVDFNQHARDIYDEPKWPNEPLFYANFPSLTDKSCAPEGQEAGFFLIPLAIGIEDTPELRQQYFDKIIDRFESLDRKSTRLNSSHRNTSRMPSSA